MLGAKKVHRGEFCRERWKIKGNTLLLLILRLLYNPLQIELFVHIFSLSPYRRLVHYYFLLTSNKERPRELKKTHFNMTHHIGSHYRSSMVWRGGLRCRSHISKSCTLFTTPSSLTSHFACMQHSFLIWYYPTLKILSFLLLESDWEVENAQ